MPEQNPTGEPKTPNKTYTSAWPRIHVIPAFIQQHRFTLSRTPEEIIGKCKDANDIFGFGTQVLADYLPKSVVAANLIANEAKEAFETAEFRQITDVEEAVQDMLDYWQFGLGKALDRRGISASRTVMKLGAWLWLLGREDLAAMIQDEANYNPYGMPALVALGDILGLEVPNECREFAGNKEPVHSFAG